MARAATMFATMMIVAMVVLPSASTTASVPAPPPQADCSSVIINMFDCMDYLKTGSIETKPSDACCDGVAKVVSFDPSCLCEGLKEAEKMQVPINMTKASGLPDACSVKVPPIGDCHAISSSPSPSSEASPPAPSPAAPSPPAPTPTGQPPSGPHSPAPSPSEVESAGWTSKSSTLMLSIAVAACSLLF